MHDRLSELSVRDLLERLSTSAPIPGGGSAAALAGAMGAALVEMVVALTSGRPGSEGAEAELEAIREKAASLRIELIELAESDAAAYDAVVTARRMPRGTDAERDARRRAVEVATRGATEAPLSAARAAAGVLELAERLAPMGNGNAISDVGVAGLLAAAAIRGAALNVTINLPYLAAADPLRREAQAEVERLTNGLDDRERDLRARVAERLA